MRQQFSMFDLWQPVPVRLPVDPYAEVVQGAADETLILPHPGMAWSLLRMELHRHMDGRWEQLQGEAQVGSLCCK